MKVKFRTAIPGHRLNEVADVDVEQGRRWVNARLAVAVDERAEEVAEAAPSTEWAKDDLIAEAERRGVDVEGTKAEIVDRLNDGA